MFSRRTKLLLVNAIFWTVAMVSVAHRRQARCAETPHGFARRAPIAGASGTNTFVCPAMYEGMPLGDKLVGFGGFVSVLAAVRSVMIDREAWRKRLQSGELY